MRNYSVVLWSSPDEFDRPNNSIHLFVMEAFPRLDRHGFAGLYPQPATVQFSVVAFLDRRPGRFRTGKVDPTVSLAPIGILKCRKHDGCGRMASGRLHEFLDVGLGGVVVKSEDADREGFLFLDTFLLDAVVCIVTNLFTRALLFKNLIEGLFLESGVVFVDALVPLAAFSFRLPVDAILFNSKNTNILAVGGVIDADIVPTFGVWLKIVRKGTILTLRTRSFFFVDEAFAFSFPF